MGLTAFLLDERTLVLSVQFLIVSHAPFRASDVKAAYLSPIKKKTTQKRRSNVNISILFVITSHHTPFCARDVRLVPAQKKRRKKEHPKGQNTSTIFNHVPRALPRK